MARSFKLFSLGDGDGEWAGFLDQEARVEGTLEVPGTFRLDGAVKGNILSRHALVLGETAQVEGEIEGERVVIYGKFRGIVRARQQVEIHPGAVVSGDVYTPCLILEPGGRFNGRCYLNTPAAEGEPVIVPVQSEVQGDPVKS